MASSTIGLDNFVLIEDQVVRNTFQVVTNVLISQSISEKKKENVKKKVAYQDTSLIQRLSVVINVQLRVVKNVLSLEQILRQKLPNGLVRNVVTINILLHQLINLVLNLRPVLVSVQITPSLESITSRQDRNYLKRKQMNV